MTQLPILVAAANLAKSPSNVRTVSDAVADAQLEANIAATTSTASVSPGVTERIPAA